jgi:hypothetical protein
MTGPRSSTHGEEPGSQVTGRRRLARIVTEVLAPAPVSLVVLVTVTLHNVSSPAEALRFGAIAVLFATLIPFAYLVRGVRRRQLTDIHVRRREQRALPLAIAIGSAAVLVGLLIWLGAPRDLVALIGAMILGLGISLLVTLFWKISVHAGSVAGALVILAMVAGPGILLAATVVVGLVAWSRVELGDHTVWQVLGGALLGTLVAAVFFGLLR